MNPVSVRVLIPRGRPQCSLNERRSVPAIDDNDPIIVLSEQIIRLFPGHQHSTIVAALSTALCMVFDGAAERARLGPAVDDIRYTLQQFIAEIVARRATPTRES